MEEFIKSADYDHPYIYRNYDFPKELRDVIDEYNQLEEIDEGLNKEYIITVKIDDLYEFDAKIIRVNLFEITDNDFTNYKNLFEITSTFVDYSESYILKIVLNSELIHEILDVLRVRNPEIDFNYFKDHFKVISGNENHDIKFLNELNRFAEFITEVIENY